MTQVDAKKLRLGDRINWLSSDTDYVSQGIVLVVDSTGVAAVWDDGLHSVMPFDDRRWSAVSLDITGDALDFKGLNVKLLKTQAKVYVKDNISTPTEYHYLVIENAMLIGALVAMGAKSK